ncbi:MAG: 30S ribosomal protein S3 [Candidatus Nealsonbacteria bacterium]|nr:30S ribosomal protein S3 [Candidatus Nealsonbacteria bacterium]
MTHKVHPKIYRVKKLIDWDSRGYYKKPAGYLEEDFKIREFLNKKLKIIGIDRIEIERFSNKTNIIISSARPGLIIGRGGEGVEALRKELKQKVLRKKEGGEEIRIEIREVRNPWISANLSAQWIAQQIEKRVPFRKVLKQALSKISVCKEVQGVRVEVSGRLGGTEIARREWLKTGKLPRQTLRANIDYGTAVAFCTYGTIGVKVWVYKGECFEK